MSNQHIDELSKVLESLFEKVRDSGLMGETFMLKLRSLTDMILGEARLVDEDRIDNYQNTFMCMSRLFDKFSADMLKAGVDEEIAEKYNRVANLARKIADIA
jgi:hypothetical protein